MTLGILGGGLSGLSLGYFLKGLEFEILEGSSECGGLLRSVQENGFTFDSGGGHIIFSRNKELIHFIRKMLRGNFFERRRNTKVYYSGRYVKYPFENGLSDLAANENYECLVHFIENKIKSAKGELQKPKNFLQWIYYNYGKGIADRYMVPYNRKIWKYDLRRISLDWVQDRIPSPSIEDVVKASIGMETEGYTHQINFLYPARGGIQALARSFENGVGKKRIITDFQIRYIEKERDGWTVSDGKDERFYTELVSTIPLPELIGAMNAPKNVKDAARRLKYNSLMTVMLGVDKPKINDLSWLYFPGNEIFHRVNFLSYYSKFVAPRGRSSMVAEITFNEGSRTGRMSDRDIIDRTLDGLHGKIADRDEVCFAKVHRTKYAYIIYDVARAQNLAKVMKFLDKNGISICGRFAEWEYFNMDACIEKAMALAGKLKTEVR